MGSALLADVSRKLGMPADQDRRALSLDFSERPSVDLVSIDDEALLLISTLGPLPASAGRAHRELMLRWNFLTDVTEGITAALDRDGRAVLKLLVSVDALDVERLLLLAEMISDRAQHWTNVLGDPKAPGVNRITEDHQ